MSEPPFPPGDGWTPCEAARPVGELPPPGGWTLIEAAEALFPDLVEFCRAQENWREAFRRLSVTLGRAVLRERDDLAIAGHDLARGIDAPPVVVPRALYDDDTMPEGSWLALDIWNSTFELRMPSPTPPIVLRGVRIFAVKDIPPVTTLHPAPGRPAPLGEAHGGGAREPQSPKPETAEAATPAPRNRGGRPERDDWVPFDREMMRLLALDGGNMTLRVFKRCMKDWAAQNMEPVPDDRTIERRVNARAPAGVFVPD